MSNSSRAYAWTTYNTQDPELIIAGLIEAGAKYIIFQEEQCPTTGKNHYQGFTRFDKTIRINAIKAAINDVTLHCEKTKGSDDSNVTYCSKQESRIKGPWEWGVRSTPGKRSDLETVRKMIVDNKQATSMRQITAMSGLNYQAVKFSETLLKYHEKSRNWETEVKWYWGATGTGKTRTAIAECPSDNTWISARNLKWWEGYDAHEYVIFDDFRADFCTFHELLRILDRYPYRIENKGASRQLLAKKIIVTAPMKPEDAYKGRTSEDIAQLLRRIQVTKEFVCDTNRDKVGGNTNSPDLRLEKEKEERFEFAACVGYRKDNLSFEELPAERVKTE